ncbi:MAG: PIN domain-containing protein [Actinobacteria bacterium]|uniref:Unannotated protein n=1 Tax=freshwater metagenome TaxID=449393 RepID=A0A6J7KLE8_9ZZZZ|nr:PIN domain-containing protein [Actinomycetota bacterium]MSW42274.1 PIN domain-containing protein [Actinomycetota bacterium]
MTFILDASVALAMVLPDEGTPVAQRLLSAVVRDEAIVPSLWHYEVASGLHNAAVRGRLSQVDATQALVVLCRLPLRIDRPDPVHLIDLSRELGLSVYDSSYLSLCLKERAPIATLDGRLAEAARAAGVSVLS